MQRQRITPDQTVAVLPEGAMINYLARRRTSVPVTNFMPTEFTVFGEDRILASFRHSPPDYVVLVHKDTSEFGFRFFGRDYGEAVFEWIRANYDRVALIGAVPLQTDRFGIELRRRTQRP